MASSNSVWTIAGVLAVILLVVLIMGSITGVIFTDRYTTKYIKVENEIPLVIGDECSDFNITAEFLNRYTPANIGIWSVDCQSGGGSWTARANEISCELWSPALMDCDSLWWRDVINFCENGLYATAICNNDFGIYGCYCNSEPTIPSAPTYTCGWVSGYDSQCGGTCPSTHPICASVTFNENVLWDLPYDECVCLDPESEEIHPDWKPDGTYHDNENPFEDGEPEEGFFVGDVGTVFITTNQWNGATGGLGGADAKCQVSAEYSNLPSFGGTWIAIMSSSTSDIINRLPNIPYYNTRGDLIGNSPADLFDGGLANRVIYTENNVELIGTAWTGTDMYGKVAFPPAPDGPMQSLTCNDWGWVSADGMYGWNSFADHRHWTYDVQSCDNAHHLYCARVN